MVKYNKNAKLIHIGLLVMAFACLILTISYMTQYVNICVYETVNGFGADGPNMPFNVCWKNFIEANRELPIAFREYVGYKGNLVTQEKGKLFLETCTIFSDFYHSLNFVNQLLLYLSITTAVMGAILFIASNHSRRIYYKSNYIVGIICPAVVIAFALVVVVLNTLNIFKLSDNLILFKAKDMVVEVSNLHFESADRLNDIINNSNINSFTLILTDVILAALIGYAAFLIRYTIKRYNECAIEREEIIAKAVSDND